MKLALLLAFALLQRPGALQPGTGIVSGSVQFENGSPAPGVRVGAMPLDDPSSLVSVAETDAAGRYRLSNIPEGHYFVVAGRLDHLTYFPGGTDRSQAKAIIVEPAKVTSIGNFSVPAESKRPVAPTFSTSPGTRETIAFNEIQATKNPESKLRLMLNFEKNFPKSTRLSSVYIELSRALASQLDFTRANDYAEKAVVSVNKLKRETPADFTPAWHSWLASLESSAKDNLAWVKQMVNWQQKEIHASTLGRR